jgi:hypothetical protein
MTMKRAPDPIAVADFEARWRLRQSYWKRKLGRLRFDAEPIEEQLARYRRVTWVLTAIPAGLAIMFLALFAVFGRASIGLVVVSVILLPIVLGAWFDHWLLTSRAHRYLEEQAGYRRKTAHRLEGLP